MIFRSLISICIGLIVCSAVVGQQATPSPSPRVEFRPLGISFSPQPVSTREQTGVARSLAGDNFRFAYELPKLETERWFTGPDIEGGTAYLVPASEIREITIRQTFDGESPTSIHSAVEKIRQRRTSESTVLRYLGEEDFAAAGIQGKVFSHSMPVGGKYPRYLREYVFTFKNALFYVSVGSATKDRLEWVRKNGDEFVKNFRVK